MAKKRFCIFILVALSALVFGLVTFADSNSADLPLSSFSRIEKFVNSNKYTQPEDYSLVTVMPAVNPEAMTLETVLGPVALDPQSLAFQFENTNGYRWSSTVNREDLTLKPYFLEEAASALIIESYNTNNPNFAIIKEHITKETTVDLEIKTNGFSAAVTFRKSQIKITLDVEFRKDGITVRIPQDKIIEPGAFKLATVAVYPFFGAVREDRVPGYAFVPDGIGALVRYRKEIPALIANYKKEIYDRNISYNTEVDLNKYQTTGTRIYMPVFGFVHGVEQNAVFAEIKNSAEYACINVYYPNFTENYTTVFPHFIYRRTYNQPMNKAGDMITLLQEKANPVDIAIDYTLLTGKKASYIGMAQTYRDRLNFKEKSQPTTIPLRLETIGLEKTTDVLFSKTIVMTEVAPFGRMIADLKRSGIDNIAAVYSGFTAAGVTWSSPDYRKISKRLGGKSAFTALNNEVSDLYLRVDYIKASSRAQGYNQYRDLSKKINDQVYQYQGATDIKYLLNYHKSRTLMNQSEPYLAALASGLAVDSMGSLLYHDFKNDLTITDQIKVYQEALRASSLKTALYSPNRYLWEELDAYFDFPMYSSQYLAFTDTVPFMAILMCGQVDSFAAAANFYPYARDELLRLIDFGVYPSFIVTENSAQKLAKTDLAAIYSSQYAVLASDIKTYYRFVSTALNPVIGAKIVDRTIVGAGLAVVAYDNGCCLVINYHHEAQNYGDYRILPKNYLVLGAADE